MVQWLKTHLSMQETWVRSLVLGDPTCRGATKPTCHNYWACMPRLLNERRGSVTREAATMRGPCTATREMPLCNNEGPVQPKINKLKQNQKQLVLLHYHFASAVEDEKAWEVMSLFYLWNPEKSPGFTWHHLWFLSFSHPTSYPPRNPLVLL